MSSLISCSKDSLARVNVKVSTVSGVIHYVIFWKTLGNVISWDLEIPGLGITPGKSWERVDKPWTFPPWSTAVWLFCMLELPLCVL